MSNTPDNSERIPLLERVVDVTEEKDRKDFWGSLISTILTFYISMCHFVAGGARKEFSNIVELLMVIFAIMLVLIGIISIAGLHRSTFLLKHMILFSSVANVLTLALSLGVTFIRCECVYYVMIHFVVPVVAFATVSLLVYHVEKICEFFGIGISNFSSECFPIFNLQDVLVISDHQESFVVLLIPILSSEGFYIGEEHTIISMFPKIITIVSMILLNVILWTQVHQPRNPKIFFGLWTIIIASMCVIWDLCFVGYMIFHEIYHWSIFVFSVLAVFWGIIGIVLFCLLMLVKINQSHAFVSDAQEI